MKRKYQHFIEELPKLKSSTSFIVVIVVVVAIGVTGLIVSRAATQNANIETENGTLSGGVSAINDSSASGGGAVQFAAPTSGFSFVAGVSGNGRYLVDQNGKPYLLVGDAPQAMIGDISEADANSYFADRQSYGFNAMWINLLCNSYTGCNSDGTTYNGVAPFTNANDITTPNPTYFQKVDDVLNLAAQHGMTVFLDPAETGGWTYFLDSNGPTKDKQYGEYLASRYKNFPNIVWLFGNDYEDWTDPSTDASVTAIEAGLKAGGDKHLVTVELNYNESLSTDDPNWASISDLNAAYSYYPTYDEVLKGYNYTPVMPVWFAEGHYDGECIGPGGCGTNIVLRRQEYWTMTSGATGQIYGNQYWNFMSGWKTGIDTVGASQLQIMANFFKSLPWYNLVPNQDHSLVTAGYGTYDSGENGESQTDDYVTAAETPDNKTAVIYVADTHTITVNMAKMNSTVTAKWFDPTSGNYTTIGSIANTGTHQFTSPAAHSDGNDDWVLLLQSS